MAYCTVALEDLIYPALSKYMLAPQWLKSAMGHAYARLPNHWKLGTDYDRWRRLAAERNPQLLVHEGSRQLRATLEVALHRVPAYADHRHLVAELDDPVAVLELLPIVGKTEIKARLQDYVAVNSPRAERLETFTGGSTSNPMRFYLQRHVSRVREYAFMADFHARLGMRGGELVLSLRGRTVPAARRGGPLWMHEPIKNNLILSSDHLHPALMPEYVAAMRRWRPAFIQAFPSALYPLAKWLALNPEPDITAGIRGVMLYSESAYPHQLELFRQVFDCPVLRHYGHSERCVMGATTTDDDRYFFWPQYGHLELVDDRGARITAPGEAGEIVCTSFDNAAMPFVRYRTGDRGVLGVGEHPELPGFPVLERVEGRLQEMVQCRDGRLISITTLGAAHFNELATVTAIQFEQHVAGELILNVETAHTLSSRTIGTISRAVEDKTQGGCTVRVREVNGIARTAAGKQVMLIQHIELSREFASPTQMVGASSAPALPADQPLAQRVTVIAPDRHARVCMIGTSRTTQGGISAVLNVYATVPGFLEQRARHIPTHADGSWTHKFRVASVAWCRYMSLLFVGRVNLLHVHSSSGPSFWRKFMFMLPTFWCRRPIVLHWHGGRFVSFFEASARWQQRIIAWTFRRCDRVIALSDQWNSTLSSTCPGARVVTIPNPVSIPDEAASVAGKDPMVLFLGRVVADKGVEDLLRAMPLVLDRVPACTVTIAGDGDIDAARALSQELRIEHAVRLPGWVSGAAKEELMMSACALVLPSHAEAMPMSVLEAMAHGLPIVASRIGGIPQAVREGLDGVLVEPRDVAGLAAALVRIASDSELRSSMGKSARERIERHFSATLIVPQIEALWRAVMAERECQSNEA